MEMNLFAKRANELARFVDPADRIRDPDRPPSRLAIGFRRLSPGIGVMILVAVALHSFGIRFVGGDDLRLIAITREVLGDPKSYDDTTARLKLKERRQLVSALETLLEANPDSGFWPSIVKVFGGRNEALAAEDARFTLLAETIKYLEQYGVDERRRIFRLAIIGAHRNADFSNLERARQFTALPEALQKEVNAITPEFLSKLISILKDIHYAKPASTSLERAINDEKARIFQTNAELQATLESARNATVRNEKKNQIISECIKKY